jgi:heptosyltransferase II
VKNQAPDKLRETGGYKNILIIKISALGDVVRSFPAIGYVRRRFPDAHIVMMTGEPYVELFVHCPHIDELIPYRKRRNLEDIGGFIRFALDIRRRRFDLVLNLQNTGRFAKIARFSGASATSAIVPHDPRLDGVGGVLSILKTVGLDPGEPRYEFWLSDDDRSFADSFFRSNDTAAATRFLGINPGVAWKSKQWPLGQYAALAGAAFEEYGTAAVIFGDKSEAGRANEVAAAIKNHTALVAAGKTTIRQAAAVIERCAAFVSNDSGLMHVASMLAVPTVGIFGPTNPDICRPSGRGHAWHYLGLPCAPCYKHECPLGTLDCMRNITPKAVLESLVPMLRPGIQL